MAACFLQDRQSLENAGSFRGSKELVKLEECNSDIGIIYLDVTSVEKFFKT